MGLLKWFAFLPEVQLSIFIRLIQIVFEYMHPIVSGNYVSNRNRKKWRIDIAKGQIQVAGLTPSSWDIIWKSQGFELLDILVFIAEINTRKN